MEIWCFDKPRNILKFALNSSIDTLAINVNIKRWDKRSNSKCSLLKKPWILHYVLFNCNIMLDALISRLYSVLNCYQTTMYTWMACWYWCKIEMHIYITLWHFCHSTRTGLAPAICFETNFYAAHERKVHRYWSLTTGLGTKGYNVNNIAVEVRSLGL